MSARSRWWPRHEQDYPSQGSVRVPASGEIPQDPVLGRSYPQLLRVIHAGDNPFNIAITPDGKTAYVTNPVANTVTPFLTATGTVLTPIKTGPGPIKS